MPVGVGRASGADQAQSCLAGPARFRDSARGVLWPSTPIHAGPSLCGTRQIRIGDLPGSPVPPAVVAIAPDSAGRSGPPFAARTTIRVPQDPQQSTFFSIHMASGERNVALPLPSKLTGLFPHLAR